MASKFVSSLWALVSRTSDPSSASPGALFFRSDTKKWRGYDGQKFVDIGPTAVPLFFTNGGRPTPAQVGDLVQYAWIDFSDVGDGYNHMYFEDGMP